MIGHGWCADCGCTVPLTQHGFCALCGSDSIAPRRALPVRREYEPEGQERLSLNCGEDAA